MTGAHNRRTVLATLIGVAATAVTGTLTGALTGGRAAADERACPEPGSAPRVHEVQIKGFKFVPDTLNVSVGDTIRWTNLDLAPHTATAIDGSWTTAKIVEGNTGELVVTAKTSGPYHCKYHPMMKATLTLCAV
jgi:plastocyanin